MKFVYGTLTGIALSFLFVVGLNVFLASKTGQVMKCRAVVSADIERMMQDPLMKAQIENDLSKMEKTLDQFIQESCIALIERGERL